MTDVIDEARRSTSQSRHEPVSLARRLAGNGDREQLVRFRATRLQHEPFLAASGKEIAMDASGFPQRAIASGPVWQERRGKNEVWLPWLFGVLRRAL